MGKPCCRKKMGWPAFIIFLHGKTSFSLENWMDLLEMHYQMRNCWSFKCEIKCTSNNKGKY